MNRKKLIAIVVCTIALVGAGLVGRFCLEYFSQEDSRQVVVAGKTWKEVLTGAREPWITIFVHGSFGSLLGLLNVYQVLNDQVKGTFYKKVVGKMRKDQFFYRDQPLLGRGLIRVEPSFDLATTGSKRLAAYPLLKVYEEITERVKPNKEKNYFYTFGWSGLISQRRRCLEAVRFYNAISEELDSFHKKGIYPKVRILTHSHGGNVVAYLAAVDEIIRLQEKRAPDTKLFSSVGEPDRRKALEWMHEQLSALPEKAVAKKRKGQKKWGYQPSKCGVKVHELIMWGMPVQPETDHFFASNVFQKVYHFYSKEDLVQRLDWVSTKQGYSDRRFKADRFDSFRKACLVDERNRMVQARIMVDCITKKEKLMTRLKSHIAKKVKDAKARKAATQAVLSDNQSSVVPPVVPPKKESFWSVLFSGGSVIVPSTKDPTHAELWFFTWHHERLKDRQFILAPFPAVVFSPLLTSLIDAQSGCDDIDINITAREKTISFGLVEHDKQELQSELAVSDAFLQPMREKVEPWRTKAVSSHDVFNLIRKYFDSV